MVAHTMGLVTFSLFDLFFSVTTKDESRTVFTLDTFADKPFAVATGISLASVILATTLDPLEALLRTTPLTVGQWLVCAAVALSIVVVSEMRKAVH
jgi:Ca2+-transporting ATPase